MNKVYLLTKLREYIFSEKVIKDVYIDVNVEKDPKYSPVGFILKEAGVSDLDLIYLTEFSPATPSIASIFSGELKIPKEIIFNMKNCLLFFGFKEEDLTELEAKTDYLIHEELYITIYNQITAS